MPVAVEIKRVTIDDIEALLTLSRKTFFDAFLHRNNPADMEAYASTAFTVTRFQEELINPHSEFYFAIADNALAGYIKLNFNAAQTDLQDNNALEVERIYILQQYQGRQIGKHLLDFAAEKAINNGLSYIWLGVWEHNAKAISFYHNNGFTQFGSHPFRLGNDEQTDILMKKKV
ncbi:GNAT family N-acetyltransferase [Mucilaginibacter sp. AK015]|uniref:GNAT family N-acetyltransferase n=1 Tax=Mucilaginibacter sp. AK015 TaxID=2723072 RepID=UPI00160B1016|nr:GNAT family N-acetyltransferase [Mucilaginibacter sp. AK015]MBB5394533.1 ribosomal protein S18 acetylase RimI-like enzyme [Mucilaginibacter sp. AK015]